MRRLLLTLSLVAACASLGYAQGSSDERDKVNVFVGFSHNRVDTGAGDLGLSNTFNDREGFNGVNASITGNVSRYVGLKFDYAYHQGDINGALGGSLPISADARAHNFLGGVQLKDNSKDSDKHFRPFGHVLVGAHSSSVELDPIVCVPTVGVPCPSVIAREDETGFAAAVGGGRDVRLNDRVSVRAVQLDWNPNRFGNAGTLGNDSRTSHNFRVGVGIVFH